MIENYHFGEIIVDGRRYTSDVIIYPDHVYSPWWRREGHKVSNEDIEAILQTHPDTIIFGTGSSGLMRVLPETQGFIEANGIKVLIEDTPKACQIYNKLYKSNRVIAALHLTC